jgi:hypothetical protein
VFGAQSDYQSIWAGFKDGFEKSTVFAGLRVLHNVRYNSSKTIARCHCFKSDSYLFAQSQAVSIQLSSAVYWPASLLRKKEVRKYFKSAEFPDDKFKFYNGVK